MNTIKCFLKGVRLRTLKMGIMFTLILGSTSAFTAKPTDKCWCGVIDSPLDNKQKNTCHLDNVYGDQLCNSCVKTCKGIEGKAGLKVPGLKNSKKASK